MWQTIRIFIFRKNIGTLPIFGQVTVCRACVVKNVESTTRAWSNSANCCNSLGNALIANFVFKNENLHAQLSNKPKIARKDPETKKWQPLEVGAESTKFPLGPAGTPPTVKRCNFGRFWSIPPPLRPNAILLFLGLFLQIFVCFIAED